MCTSAASWALSRLIRKGASMSLMNEYSFRVPLEELPKGFIATSHSGHLFEVDLNRYTGVLFISYPKDAETLSFLSRAFNMAQDSGFLYDLLNHPANLGKSLYSSGTFVDSDYFDV